MENIIYVVIWSGGLLYGSFHEVFEGSQTYLFCGRSLEDAVEGYVFPMVMSMLLFLFDVIYNALKDRDEGRQTNIISILFFLSLFLLGFLMPLLYNNIVIAVSGFWTAWISLTLMKLFATCHAGELSVPNGSLPIND